MSCIDVSSYLIQVITTMLSRVAFFPFSFIKEKAHPFQRPKKKERKKENQPAQQEQSELHNLT